MVINCRIGIKIRILVLISTLLLATITGCSKVDPVEELLESDQLGYYTDDLSDIQFTENKVDHVVDEEDKKIYILDYQIIDSILGNKKVTVDDVYKSIDKNQNLPDDYKEHIKAFTKAMDEYYGVIDYKIYNYNMKNISIEKLTPEEKEEKNIISIASFDCETAVLTLNSSTDITNEYDRMVVNHELGHCYNNVCIPFDDYKIVYQFNYNFDGKYFKEGADVKFTLAPFEDEYSFDTIKRAGYSVITNLIDVIIDVADISFNDTITQNIYDIEERVEALSTDKEETFDYIEDILELQWIQHRDVREVIPHSYYDVEYEYITNLYLNKYANADMSESELNQLEEKYIEKVKYRVYHNDTIGLDGIHNSFEKYKMLHEIGQNTE